MMNAIVVNVTTQNVAMLESEFSYCYAECHYDACRYIKCRYAECCYAK
jgi:hypothetical protein